MKASNNRCLTVVLVGFVVLALAACSSPGTPKEVVERAFEAYRKGNSNAINNLMSEQGLSNASLYCGDAAITCLKSNYGNKGELISSYAEVTSETDTTAEVELHTTWSEREDEQCQTYQLDKTNKGWRITYFDEPWPCD